MTRVAIDTWAFLAIFFGEERAPRVGGLIDESDGAFTTREVVVETFNSILKEERRATGAWEWWNALRESHVRVFEPPLDEVHAYVSACGQLGTLSLADWSLAFVATRERTKAILSEDATFRRIGLDPLFAR